jgi:PAS domain S-box-containing protein
MNEQLSKARAGDPFRALFDRADAILIADDHGRYVEVNAAACELLGYSRAELLTMSVHDLVPPGQRADVSDQWAAFLRERFMAREFDVWRKDGTKRTIEFRAVAHFVPGLHFSAFRDATSRKQVEEELRTSREQLRRLSARADQSLERQRTDVARELHDQLGQFLTALKMELVWLSRRLPKEWPETFAVRDRIQALGLAIDSSIHKVRRLSAELRPIALDRLGLIEAIEWQAGEFERRTGIRCRVQSRPETVDIDGDRATHVFRILQEALLNASRHAAATRVSILPRRSRNAFTLTIHDNGCGISDAALRDPGALGLVGMRERALLAGGSLRIARARHKGTVVVVVLPFAGSSTRPS